MSKIEDLTRQIEEAFAQTAYPGDDNLVCDDYGVEGLDDYEQQELKKGVQGKHWREIHDTVLDMGFQDNQRYFTPAAFRYYLPAYLIAALGYVGDSLFVLTLVSTLTPTPNPYWRSVRFVKYLSPEQNDVIIQVLHYLERTQANKDRLLKQYIEDAFTQYWSNPEGNLNRLLANHDDNRHALCAYIGLLTSALHGKAN